MTKYILHGGFTRWDNELNQMFFEEIARDVPDGGTVLISYFAQKEGEDNTERGKEHINMLRSQSHGKDLRFEFATMEEFPAQVKRGDAIFFNGGNTRTLLTKLHAYPEFETWLSGKTVAGSSAGAYALARYGSRHSDDTPSPSGVYEGFGIVPVRVVCHYESRKLPPLPESVAILEGMVPELPLVYLRDCEWRCSQSS